jgi:hypothetical protein
VDRPGDQAGHHLSWSQLIEATGRRRSGYIWAPPFAVLLAILCVRNRFLFSEKLYEQGDAGANSILITQAKHFTLLVGNYSREGFNHPGPAYLYVQAAGEWLLYNLLHVVPTPWNAHMLAVFALNAAFVALGVVVVYGWTRAGAAASLAVLVALALWQPAVLTSDWMPYMYVLPYVVLLLAAASVVAGASRDVWIVTLSGWLLIHGQACFLLFVPVIVAATVALVMWRFGWRACLDRFRSRPAIWLPVTVICAVFLLPIVVNLVLHWPGDFGKYLSYSKSAQAGGHSARQILDYLLWFWWPHASAGLAYAGLAYAWLVPLIGYAIAVAVTLWLAARPLRRPLLALLVLNMVSTVLLIVYAAVGIDYLTQYYIGYFYWSAPAVTSLVIVLAVLSALPLRLAAALGAAGAVAAIAVLAVLPGTRTASTNDIDQALPRAVATLAAQAHGKTIVLDIDHSAWVQTTGFLVQAERTGVPICVDQSWYQFLFSRQFICTQELAASGVRYAFVVPAATVPAAGPAAGAGVDVVMRFNGVTVLRNS